MEGPNLAALYEQKVRSWARKVRDDARLAAADLSIMKTSPVCGSSLTLDIDHDGRTITALGYRVRACTLGMASTALVVDTSIGSTFEEVTAVGVLLKSLLAGTKVAFPGPWRELDMFMAARSFPSRHGSIMLPFEVLGDARQVGRTNVAR